MSRLTKGVGVESLGGLLKRATGGIHACLDARGVRQALPMWFLCHEGRFWAGLPAGEG